MGLLYKESANATGDEALSLTIGPNGTGRANTDGFPWQLLWVAFKASGAMGTNDTVTITLDSHDGATYDALLNSDSVSAATSYLYVPDTPIVVNHLDDLVIAVGNASKRTVGLTAQWVKVIGEA